MGGLGRWRKIPSKIIFKFQNQKRSGLLELLFWLEFSFKNISPAIKMSSYQEEPKQETQQCVTGCLLNTEGLPTVLDQYLKVSERICQIEASQKGLTEEVKFLKQQKESLKEQIDECLKEATNQEELKESIAQMLGRLEAHENDSAVLKNDLAVLKNDSAVLKNDLAVLKNDLAVLAEKDEKKEQQIEQLHDAFAEQQRVINQLINKENLHPGTLLESTPQSMSTPTQTTCRSIFHDESGYLSTHSIRSKSSVSDEEELKLKLEYIPDGAPTSTH